MIRTPRTVSRLLALLAYAALCAAFSGPETGAALAATAAPETAAAPDRPNLLLIMTDDQGDADGSLERMSKLQAQLVSGGVSFANAFPATNQCCPSPRP